MYALWALRSAFEESPSSPEGSAAATKNAAMWIRYAGPALKELSLAGRDLQDNMGAAGDRYSDKGWKGFCQERWQAWKDGLELALKSAETDSEVQELLKASALF